MDFSRILLLVALIIGSINTPSPTLGSRIDRYIFVSYFIKNIPNHKIGNWFGCVIRLGQMSDFGNFVSTYGIAKNYVILYAARQNTKFAHLTQSEYVPVLLLLIFLLQRILYIHQFYLVSL